MGKKGRKTRWRKLPIPIGTGNGRGGWEEAEADEPKRHQPPQPVSPTTFNEDEYTRITTPRQDMLFKKGYLGKKKTSNPPQDTTDTQSAGDSVESESYACDETANQYIYSGGYVDPTGMYYLNNGYEMYDPYTGAVTVIVGPGPQNGYGPQVLAAVPCAPLPLQPLEWFNPAAPQPPFSLPPNYLHRKKRSSVDSQNCSGQSSETTCNPGSPPEPTEGVPDANGQPFYPPQYVYPGAYMFGAPLYNMNGVSVQGMVPPATAPPPADPAKRRKKRRRRRRGGAVTDEGSESSCEEVSCEAGNESQSGASSDTALGSSSSKTNSDSGIHTDPTANSGSNSPQILETNYYYPMSPTENLVEPPKSPEPTVTSHGKVPEEPQEQAELNCTTEPVTELEATSESLATISCDVASDEVFTVSSQPCDESILRLEEQVEHLESQSLPESTFEQTQEVTSSCHNELVSCPEPTQDLSEPTLDLSLIPEVLQTPVPNEDVDHQLIQEEQEPQSNQNEESTTHIEPQAFCLLELKENLPQELQDDTITSLTCETKIDVGLEEEQCTSDFASTPASPLSPAEEYYTSDETDPIPLSPTLVHSEPQSPRELVESATAYIETTSQAVQIEEVCSKAEQMEEVCSKAVQMEEVCNKIDSGLFEPDSIRVEEVEAYQVILNEDRVSDRPITEAVTKWLESQGSRVLSSSIVAEGERIEEGIDPLTGQKNGEGNPFLASSPSDSRTRVAKTNVRDVLNEETRVRAMCDPKSSVEKYYRLAAETASDKSAPPSSGQKTAMHFGRAGPFPCGVCCILQ